MTKTVNYRNWIFEVDYERTKEVYGELPSGSPERCTCSDCKNYSVNRENIYPQEIKNLLSELGIDYKKEVEIYSICRLNNGQYQYGGWFHFKGRIKVGRDCKVDLGGGTSQFQLETITDGFDIGFTKDFALRYFEDEEKNDLIQIEFTAISDWVIGKELESE